MLCLSRKVGDSIIIGDNISVYVIEIDWGQVRLGIKAPRDISIHRNEVYERIMKENQLKDGNK